MLACRAHSMRGTSLGKVACHVWYGVTHKTPGNREPVQLIVHILI